jgi:hypothetical protein
MAGRGLQASVQADGSVADVSALLRAGAAIAT